MSWEEKIKKKNEITDYIIVNMSMNEWKYNNLIFYDVYLVFFSHNEYTILKKMSLVFRYKIF